MVQRYHSSNQAFVGLLHAASWLFPHNQVSQEYFTLFDKSGAWSHNVDVTDSASRGRTV